MSDDEYIEFSAYELEAIRAGIKEELFEVKKYILQKAPIMGLFKRKIQRLQSLIEVQTDLFPDDVNNHVDSLTVNLFNQTEINTLFAIYFANKNKLKHALSLTESLSESIDLITKLCENEKNLGQLFSFLEVNEEMIVSKEPDPMDIHAWIQQITQQQIRTLEDVKNRTNELPIDLLNEMKRLFLLAKKY
jgi:hypothetical protein